MLNDFSVRNDIIKLGIERWGYTNGLGPERILAYPVSLPSLEML